MKRRAFDPVALGKRLAQSKPRTRSTRKGSKEAAEQITAIARAMHDEGVALRHIALTMDVDYTILSRLLRGERDSVGWNTIIAVEKALNIKLPRPGEP